MFISNPLAASYSIFTLQVPSLIFIYNLAVVVLCVEGDKYIM